MSAHGFRTEWGSAQDFAEVARALGVPTDRIVASVEMGDGGMLIVYTPGLDDDTWSAVLDRDRDGALRDRRPRRREPGFMEQVRASLDERLG